MSILHLNIASFPVEVERLIQPRLRGRPVAIAASPASRAPLVSVSKEAHAMGIHKGMPQRQARRHDRRLLCLLPNPSLYQKAQRKLLQVVSHFTPRFEPMRPGSVFLDMGGMELLFGRPDEAAERIRRSLLERLQLKPTMGIAENKLVSRVAAKVSRPQGLCEVFPGNEENFLHPLEIEFLPGIGKWNAAALFRELGMRRIGDVAQIPVELLTQLFGRMGRELYEKAHGQDISAVSLPKDSEQLCAEAFLEEPNNADDYLLAQLWLLVEQLGAQLRRRHQVTAQGHLEIRYVDGRSHAADFKFNSPTQSDFMLFQQCEARWKKLYPRRTQLKSISFTLSELKPHATQLDFTNDQKEASLLNTLDQLRKKHGPKTIQFARTIKNPHLTSYLKKRARGRLSNVLNFPSQQKHSGGRFLLSR